MPGRRLFAAGEQFFDPAQDCLYKLELEISQNKHRRNNQQEGPDFSQRHGSLTLLQIGS